MKNKLKQRETTYGQQAQACLALFLAFYKHPYLKQPLLISI